MRTIGLQVEGSPPQRPTSSDFRYLWAKHVVGINPRNHCAACLRGNWERTVRRGMVDGLYRIETAAPFFYICGVARNWKDNLHIAVHPSEDENDTVISDTVVGMRLTLFGVKRITIAPLPDNWQGLSKRYTTCRNFQFAVQQFGYDLQEGQPSFEGM